MPGELLWEPSEERRQRAVMTRFMRERGFDTYEELWQWSVDDLEGFWGAIWEFFGVGAAYDSVLGDRTMPGAEWFPGARLNYAAHIFADKDDDALAIIARSELRDLQEITWGELREQVERAGAGLKRLGVQEGDRVVAYLPNIPETVVAFLAAAS